MPPSPLSNSRLVRARPRRPDRSERERRRAALGGARAATPQTFAGLVERAIAAVNARGLCAVDVARVAELPEPELRAMSDKCGCTGCWQARAN